MDHLYIYIYIYIHIYIYTQSLVDGHQSIYVWTDQKPPILCNSTVPVPHVVQFGTTKMEGSSDSSDLQQPAP